MKIKKTICLLLITLVTGCSASFSLSGESHSNDKVISIGDTTTTTKTTKTTAKTTSTTKENKRILDNTIWEFIGTNSNYKYIYFKDDSTNVDEFAVYKYDTVSRFKTSACHFVGFGDVLSNDNKETIIELDNGSKYNLKWLSSTSFNFEGVTYNKVANDKITLVACN